MPAQCQQTPPANPQARPGLHSTHGAQGKTAAPRLRQHPERLVRQRGEQRHGHGRQRHLRAVRT